LPFVGAGCASSKGGAGSSQAARGAKDRCLQSIPSTNDNPTEPSMTNTITTQAAAFGLAAFVTLGVLLGLNGLAANEYQAAQQIASAPALQATPISLPG
jgi:hypothetical protein